MMYLSLAATVAVLFIVKQLCIFMTTGRLPKDVKELPGPKGYPFIGVLLEFPKEYSYRKLKEWADEYGPIYKITIMGATHVVITSHKIANDLLALKGGIYSDRLYFTMGHELASHKGNIATSPPNKYWHNARRFAQAQISSTAAASTWRSRQAAEAPRLVCDLLENPRNYVYLFERYSTVMALRMGFGINLPAGPEESEHVKTIMKVVHTIERVNAPGSYLVDFITILKHLPEFLAPFKAEAKELFNYEYSYFVSLFSSARKSYEAGEVESPKCFAHAYLGDLDRWSLSDFEIAYTLGILFVGGSGTTSAAMQSFCLAMCHYPEWLAKAQKELDDIVGSDRIPTFEDVPNLPTIRAVIKETLRWRPVVPGGIPHRLTEDDSYQGYFIPKGSVVHANHLGMSRDETQYPDTETFNPDRWLNPKYPSFQAPLTQYPNLKRDPAFGFGRRICPGLESAEQSLFIEVASLVWACNISPTKNSTGNSIPIPWYDYTIGNNTAPKKFQFDITSRDENRARLMRMKSSQQ